MAASGPNTLYADVSCPKCGKKITSGIGFRAGQVNGFSYKLGEKLKWDGPGNRPKERPASGSLKTIGYFECDNLDCETWQDCYPEVQEALIVIHNDVITEAKSTVHNPGVLDFDIIEPKE